MAKAKKLPSGNWRVQLYIGKDNEGKRQYKSFTNTNKRAAELEAAEFAAAIPDPPAEGDMTLGEAMDKYISIKSNVLSPTTIKSYKSCRRNRLQPLMSIYLSKLTAEAVQLQINAEAADHSPKTIRNLYGLLTATLRMYAPGVTLTTTLPKRIKMEIRIPSRDEIKKIYEYLQDGDMEVPFLLASQAGLRLSEICALTWADVTDGDIHVNKALVRGEGGHVIKKPKSYAGYRHVTCSKSLTDLILATKTDRERVVLPPYDSISTRWPNILIKLGIPHFRFHDLRHYYASEGLLLGVPPKYMAELMGHSSTDMINQVYQHTFKDSKRQFAQALADKTDTLLK